MSDNTKVLESTTVYTVDEEPKYSINIQNIQSYGSTDEMVTGRLGQFAVDKKGNVFVVDTDQNVIHIFFPDGSYSKSFGRKGRGPAEFISPPNIDLISNKLYLFDFMQFRVSVFTPDSLNLVFTKNIVPRNQSKIEELANFRLSRVFFRNDGNVLVEFQQPIITDPNHPRYNANNLYSLFYLMDENGHINPDKILKMRSLIFLSANVNGEFRASAGYPFLGEPLITVSDSGYIYSAWSQKFFIDVRDPKGEHLYSIQYPFKRAKLTRETALQSIDYNTNREVLAYRTGIIENVEDKELPETWPALNSMQIDDENRLWISTIVEDFKVYQWWVINEKGELLARFNWPRDKDIEVVKNGHIYTRETETDTGLQQIVKYRFDIH